MENNNRKVECGQWLLLSVKQQSTQTKACFAILTYSFVANHVNAQ